MSTQANAKKSPTKKSTQAVKKNPAANTNLIQRVTLKAKNTKIGKFSPGDTVNVYVKVKEGEKERTQVYKGIVTKVQGSGNGRSFTVRKISAGVGVERTFPFVSPAVESVEVLTTGKVRRSKLYYLRSLEGKAAKIESEIAGTSSATDDDEAAEAPQA
jgi:large subunit ribosomal protein L19